MRLQSLEPREFRNHREARFDLRGLVEDRIGVSTEIVARRGAGGAKEITVDGEGLPRLTDLMGRFRTVHFLVEDVAALNGGPASRRRFRDVALYQLEPAYVGSLRDYATALKQRNRLLVTDRRASGAAWAESAAWEEILARAGVALDRRRRTPIESVALAGSAA